MNACRVVVGVHVRVHDSRFDWAVVPPSPGAGGAEGDGSAEVFGESKEWGDCMPLLDACSRLLSYSDLVSTAISTLDFAQVMLEINNYMTPDRVLFYVTSNKDAVKKELQG
jgi:hypothetical protein